MTKNVLLCTDVYKMGHMEQFPEGITKAYAYLVARSDKKIPFTLFSGLQPILKEYLSQPITHQMVTEFLQVRESILGPTPKHIFDKMHALADLGYIPLEIKAVPEGTVLPVKNVLLTMTNTDPEFAWTVGFFESLVLKVWNPITVGSYSMKLRHLVDNYADETVGNRMHCDWAVHDFGYRGCSSEETAAISGAAHLINFRGTDTVPAVKFLMDNYNATGLIGGSVPASEHSVMCSYGQADELKAFEHMLNTYPTGIVSIVSDTYNLWNVLENFTKVLHKRIIGRQGKVVFRPDSGDPELIICGNPAAPAGSPENLGAIRLLDREFGSTVNDLGFKELNPHVGLIYGDGMYFERYERILARLKAMGYASSNLVIGVGGLLLQQHSRDDQGFAIKTTYVEIGGIEREIVKDPITDSGKKSHKGLLRLDYVNGRYVTTDQVSHAQEQGGLLDVVFRNGQVVKEFTLEDVRKTAYKV